MNPRRCLSIGAIALSLLAGCDSPANAERNTFQAVLQSYYDARPVCVTIALTFPVERRSEGDAAWKQQLDALVAAGLVSATPFQKSERTIRGEERAVDHLRYAPTADGEKALRKAANAFIGGTDICFARRKVTAVESFTEPADLAGLKVSQVTYTYELADIEPWATRPDISAAFRRIGAVLAKPSGQATEGLVQTSDGWKHEREIR